MKKTILGIAFILIIFTNSEVNACEPCSIEKFDFETTVKHADLIIMGEKISEELSTEPKSLPSEPAWIKVKVLDVLKGKESEREIKVHSWSGMCGYGIVVGEGKYIMFLSERKHDSEDFQYGAVNYGCSVKTYPVEENMVVFGTEEQKKEKITLEQFVQLLNKALNKE